jgi:hypothetical protein
MDPSWLRRFRSGLPASEVAAIPAGRAAVQEAERGVPARLVWALVALVLGLAGWLMLLSQFLGIAGYALIGVGAGIGCAVAGSLAHDALAGPRARL